VNILARRREGGPISTWFWKKGVKGMTVNMYQGSYKMPAVANMAEQTSEVFFMTMDDTHLKVTTQLPVEHTL